MTGKTGAPDAGTYVLIMRCDKSRRTRIGRLGDMSLRPGFFLYVGSARGPGGLSARVARHRRRDKKLHWHIDYLRRHTALIETWTLADETNHEHDWAAALAMHYPIAMPRFGASDCSCGSHLFFSVGRPGPRTIDAELVITVY